MASNNNKLFGKLGIWMFIASVSYSFCVFQEVNSIVLDLYYEALCPYCRDFIVKELLPTWEFLKTYSMNQESNFSFTLNLCAFGNAKETKTPTGYDFTCQHGEGECHLNKVQVCGMAYSGFDRTDLYLPWIECIERAPSVYNQQWENCAKKFYTPSYQFIEDVRSCAKGTEGQKLLHEMALSTPANHEYVPWIVIDGEHDDSAQYNLKKSLCKRMPKQIPHQVHEWCAADTRNIRHYENEQQDETNKEYAEERYRDESEASSNMRTHPLRMEGSKSRRNCKNRGVNGYKDCKQSEDEMKVYEM